MNPKYMKNATILILLTLLLVPLQAHAQKIFTSEQILERSPDFGSYWYRGLAELNRYELQQVRYGEIHPGESVVIFVTEDFLRDKQVKYEFGDGKNKTSILKTHHHRKFWTGVYPYHIHTSAFVPVDLDEPSLKLAFTSTEWCGVVYAQINRNSDGLRSRLHSYFQAEGDQDKQLPAVEMEDALWSRARIDPRKLPTGSFELLPGMHYLRMLHKPVAAYPVSASLKSSKSQLVYTLKYGTLDREVKLFIEPTHPFRITRFEETYSPLGAAQPMTTVGVLKKSVMLDYWSHHGLKDAWMRGEIGLSE
jgi:hypothetical protein